MTITWSVEHDAIIVVLEGNYTSDELERAVSSALYSPRFPAGGALLINGSHATGDATTERQDRAARFVTSLLDHAVISRCAVIPAREGRGSAMLVQARVRESGGEMRVLDDIEEGLTWVSDAAASADREGPLSSTH